MTTLNSGQRTMQPMILAEETTTNALPSWAYVAMGVLGTLLTGTVKLILDLLSRKDARDANTRAADLERERSRDEAEAKFRRDMSDEVSRLQGWCEKQQAQIDAGRLASDQLAIEKVEHNFTRQALEVANVKNGGLEKQIEMLECQIREKAHIAETLAAKAGSASTEAPKLTVQT